MNCKCGNRWKIQENLSAYEGEVVLVCEKCGERYFNAQNHFSAKLLSEFEHVVIKGGGE